LTWQPNQYLVVPETPPHSISTQLATAPLLKAKIAVALQDELGHAPSEEKINEVFLLTRVMYKAVLGLHFKRKEQKKQGQLAIF
jgi:hypothetical protein